MSKIRLSEVIFINGFFHYALSIFFLGNKHIHIGFHLFYLFEQRVACDVFRYALGYKRRCLTHDLSQLEAWERIISHGAVLWYFYGFLNFRNLHIRQISGNCLRYFFLIIFHLFLLFRLELDDGHAIASFIIIPSAK